MAALERDDERLDPSTRVLTVLARISKTRLPNYRDDVYRLKREQEQKQDFFFRTSICNPFLRWKIIEKVSAVLSLDKWSFSFDFFLPFLWKDVDKLTCVVTETNYILASP